MEKKETLDEKQKKLDGLVATIELRNRLLSHEERNKVEAVEIGLKMRLDMLVEECKLKEADLKISAMEQILEITNIHKNG